jgi:hypothetical protein
MLLDVHCHVVPPEIAADPAGFGRRDPHFARLAITKGARFCTGEELLRDMERDGVDRAVAFGFAFKDTGVSRLQNDYAISLAKANPGRIVAFGVLDPESPGALQEAERCLSAGARGFGELFPSGHGFSLEGEAMSRLAYLAADAGVPLLIHVNEPVGHQYPGKGDAGPLDAYRFAVKNPGTTTVFAHLGGGLPFYSAMPEVLALANLFYDTAAQPYLFRPQVYRSLEALGILDRIVLGSDYPLLSCKRYLREVEKSGLPAEQVDKIVWRNAWELLGRFFCLPDGGNS